MKVLVIVDSHYSAIGLSAHTRAKINGHTVISASEFISPRRLLTNIYKFKPTVVFFAWRKALLDVLHDGSRSHKLLRKMNSVSFGVLIPDLQGLESSAFKDESVLLNFVDFYMVTSRELEALYLSRFPTNVPIGVYRDLPDVNLIEEIKEVNACSRKKRVIWVGNSKWGIRQGAIDHKGMHAILIPLMQKKMNQVEFKVIDSSSSHLPHKDVLREIQGSSVLLQTSKSEGTGLPLLEAAGLGTVVVTTNVGIAREFLTEELAQLIVEPKVDTFSDGIDFALHNFAHLSQLLQARFRSYIREILVDSLVYVAPTKIKVMDTFSTTGSKLVRLKWIRRWLLAKL